MKKCPYCAEDIQDTAIVCRYCGRDLVPATPPAAQPRQGNPKSIKTVKAPSKKSVWKSALPATVVITILYVIQAIFTAPNQSELAGSLTVGLFATFVVWWVICATVVWLWRVVFK